MNRKRVLSASIVVLLLTAAAVTTGQVPLPDLFVASDQCMSCHNQLIAPGGEDISIGTDWRSSMMANAARDPYWQASVRRETLVHPSASAAIQHECSACHMPMTRYEAKAAGQQGMVFDHLPIVDALNRADLLAADGVSCAMCHQIQEEGLGEESGFTAGFVVDNRRAMGQRKIFGPYVVDDGRKNLMNSSARFTPEQKLHIKGSGLCATCHTLYTHALDEEGNVTGELPEQVPYLEWEHSDYYGKRSCQSCHMPMVETETPITGVVGQDRPEVNRHVFRGGNFFMPRILNAHRKELGVAAQPGELEVASVRTKEHLDTSSARLALEGVGVAGGHLAAEVVIINLAGHKLPSAYPSRRSWIHFTVRDGQGDVVFESGRMDPDGSIRGNENDRDPSRFEPHYREITSPDQVQIYEPILGDPGGEVTTVLLTATRYLKDNRLLPKGFDKSTADPDIAVYGEASQDRDFTSGGDRVRYTVPIPAGRQGPFTVEAALCYQPIGFRWAHNLKQHSSDEGDRFVGYFEQMADRSGTLLARKSVELP
ncbi:MAG: hypothetical protein R6W82_10365 [bacterium]